MSVETLSHLPATLPLKLSFVVGEDVIQTSIAERVSLGLRTRQIVETTSQVRNVRCDVVETDRVVVRGSVIVEITFVDADNRVRSVVRTNDFTALAGVPGARAGHHCQVQAVVNDVSARLIEDRRDEAEIRAALQLFIKVTQFRQATVATDPGGPLARVLRVTGERAVPVVIEDETRLAEPADKVREIRVRVREVRAEALDGQVVVEGEVLKEVFFISAEDQVEMMHEEVLPFSGVGEVPGARAGMEVQVQQTLERVFHRLVGTLPSRRLQQRITLTVVVKVAEEVLANIATVAGGPLVKVDAVRGQGGGEVLVEATTTLAMPARRIQDITARVEIARTEVIDGRVLVEGTLHKQIFFIGQDDFVRHQREDVPFGAVITVPGAAPQEGQEVMVTPAVEFLSFTLVEPPADEKEEKLDEEVEGLHFALRQRAVVRLNVRVLEPMQVNVRVVDAA